MDPITLAHVAAVAGRSLLAALFILAAVSKSLNPKPTLAHMAKEHVPGFLLPAVILLELGAGGALLLGWNTRIAAGVLALFCVGTAALIHLRFADAAERTQFAKDIALAGALTFVAASAQG